MKKIIIFCLLFFALNSATYGAQPSKIELTDGSIINGEIISYSNDIYTINSPTFGEIKIESAKVAKIESLKYALPNNSISPAAQNNIPTPSQISNYGQNLINDPENAAIIEGMAINSGLQELANDLQVREAAKTGDIQALLKNPKFMNMVSSPEMQEALKKLKQ